MKTAILVFILTLVVSAQDASQSHPPVTKDDVRIVQRAAQILDSPVKWNRADDRKCPAGAKTFSLYCALEMATDEVRGNFEHRGAAMQEARFVIEELTPNKEYDHRLMGYNNDPTTTFADIRKVFSLLEARIAKRLADPVANKPGPSPAAPVVSKKDVQIASRARAILDSPAKWNHSESQNCPANATTFNLYCALVKAATEINGDFDASDEATKEAKRIINASPNHSKYKARLIDYNNDPTITFADIQNLLKAVEERLTQQTK